MSKDKIYHYYVEGDDEKKIVNTLKSKMEYICSGKVDTFNMIQNKFTVAKVRLLKPETIVVLIYDTDVDTKLEVLEENITFLKRQKNVKSVLCIPQIKNLDDELKYACNIKYVKEITKSSSMKEYKHDLITCSNLDVRLLKCNFKIEKFWSRIPENAFKKFGNDAQKIKKVKR